MTLTPFTWTSEPLPRVNILTGGWYLLFSDLYGLWISYYDKQIDYDNYVILTQFSRPQKDLNTPEVIDISSAQSLTEYINISMFLDNDMNRWKSTSGNLRRWHWAGWGRHQFFSENTFLFLFI